MAGSAVSNAGLIAKIFVVFLRLASSAPHRSLPDIKPVQLANTCVQFHPHSTPLNEMTPVIMLHGVPSYKEDWNGVYEVIATETRRKVCILDTRDHGDSPWTDSFSLDATAVDLNNFMEQHNISKAILLGHSFGGLTAMKLALTKPEKVEKLIVEDMAPRNFPASLVNDSIAGFKMMKDSLKFIPAGSDLQTAKRAVRDYLMKMDNIEPGHEDYMSDENADKLLLTIKAGVFKWKTNYDGLIAALEKGSMATEISGLYTEDALFLYGTKSPFRIYEDKDLILKFFPKAHIIGIEGASHIIHHDFPQFMTEVLKFIKGHQ